MDGCASSDRGPSLASVHLELAWRGTELDEAIRAHERLSEELAARPTNEKTCALAHSAQALAPLLAGALESRHAELMSQTADGAGASGLAWLETQAAQEGASLVGIGLHVGAEVIYSHVRYDEIADVGPLQPDAAALLHAVAGLWRNPTGWPIDVEQQADVTGCRDPGALVGPLEHLRRTWSRAPDCVRALVTDVVHQSIRDGLSLASCYCRRQENVVEAVARLTELAEGLRLDISQAESDTIAMHLHGKDARFDCLAN